MPNLLLKIRILPMVIFVATMLLTVKVYDIWGGVSGMNADVGIARAEAQQKPAAPAADSAAESPKAAPTEEKAVDAAKAESRVAMPTDDPTLFTQSEIDLLQQLAVRREEIDKRSSEINMREGLLQAAESRINKKLDELKKLQATIEGLIKTHDQQQEVKMASLVKIYENMKPQDAARIFEELDMETLLMVAERMKERKLAPVMAKMNPGKAKEMTVELARMRDLPVPGAARGG
ncbi:MAG: hypothetical protein OQJ99_08185 [Rhodospirillales bacterium]|nr:hypothetical protein [Rhodospirillales bacterium]